MKITRNPYWEDFQFDGVLAGLAAPKLMELDIRTPCVPEPDTLLALGLGASTLIMRRRIRRI